MIFGRSVLYWLLIALIAVCIFFLAQWLIPLVFGLVGVSIPPHIINVLALLIAIGCFYVGYTWRVVPPAA